MSRGRELQDPSVLQKSQFPLEYIKLTTFFFYVAFSFLLLKSKLSDFSACETRRGQGQEERRYQSGQGSGRRENSWESALLAHPPCSKKALPLMLRGLCAAFFPNWESGCLWGCKPDRANKNRARKECEQGCQTSLISKSLAPLTSAFCPTPKKASPPWNTEPTRSFQGDISDFIHNSGKSRCPGWRILVKT